MKLTDLNIDGYGICRNLRLSHFNNGLNIIYGGNSSGKSTVVRYIRNVIFGFDHDDHTCHGNLVVQQGNISYRLTRPASLTGQLVSEGLNSGTGLSQSPAALQHIDAELFDLAYHFDARDARQIEPNISALLTQRFRVPLGKTGGGNESEYYALQNEIESRKNRLESLKIELSALETEQSSLASNIDNTRSNHQARLSQIELEINDITNQLNSRDLQAIRDLIGTLEHQITESRDRLDRASHQVEYVPTQEAGSDGLNMLYLRLDEIDLQIRRWRHVQTDIQNQRVRLRDEMLVWNEMTMDSSEHPYHNARKILTTLEQKVGQTEVTAQQARDSQTTVSLDAVANQVLALCNNMREDLYSLCNELGNQYKEIRHKAATSELKQLRRCYVEMGESLQRLINRRDEVIGEIRQADPAGAEAIVRAENQFCHCAQHEGFIEARRRYVGDMPVSHSANYRVVQPDLSAEHAQLADLVKRRATNVHRLVELENEIAPLASRRDSLIRERDQFGLLNLSQLENRLHAVQTEIRTKSGEYQVLSSQVEQDRLRVLAPPCSILNRASELVERLTLGEIDQLFISKLDHSHQLSVVANGMHRQNMPFMTLSSGTQQQIVLALNLAIVEDVHRSGKSAPMLLDDVWVNLDPQRVTSTFDTLVEFCQQGIQIVAVTAEQGFLSRAQRFGVTVFELPETGVSPAPFISPERTPTPLITPPRDSQFISEFETSHFSAPRLSEPYPMHKYAGTPVIQSHAPENFDAAPKPTVLEFAPTIDETTPLRNFELIQPIFLTTLSETGIHSVGDLLDLAPTLLTQAQQSRGLTPEIVDRWQSVIWLMISVPGLRIQDAQILMANGISEPEQLDTTAGSQLHNRITRYLAAADGSRFSNASHEYTTDRINRWFRALDRTRSRWRNETGYSRLNRHHRLNESGATTDPAERAKTSKTPVSSRPPKPAREPRRFTREPQTPREPRSAQRDRQTRLGIANTLAPEETPRRSRKSSSKKSKSAPSTGHKFYLDLTDHIEAAPSIGPKTAEKFEKVGAHTISEFLNRTAESMASKINYKRISADVVRQWQNQTRLVCRVPNLRGHDAQLLVACGITEPEDLADMNPKDLFEIIEPFAKSKEGLKIIRSGKQPDLNEIKDWITWAGDTRSLAAA